jgi:hypothetical protein
MSSFLVAIGYLRLRGFFLVSFGTLWSFTKIRDIASAYFFGGYVATFHPFIYTKAQLRILSQVEIVVTEYNKEYYHLYLGDIIIFYSKERFHS